MTLLISLSINVFRCWSDVTLHYFIVSFIRKKSPSDKTTLRNNNFTYKQLTEIIAIIMRAQPSVLFNVDVTATGGYFRHSRVTVNAGIVRTGDSLTSRIVASTNPARVKFGRWIQDVIASSRLALTVNAHVKSVGTTRGPVDYFIT